LISFVFEMERVGIFAPVKRRGNLDKKYAAICAEYRRLSAIQEYGVKKYSYERILSEMEAKFFYTPDYIARIVRNEPLEGYVQTPEPCL
jgi:hypothetical protein